MKHLANFFYLLFSLIIFLSACNNDEESLRNAEISFVDLNSDSTTVTAGDTVNLNIRIDKGDYNLQELAIFSDITGTFDQIGTGVDLANNPSQTQDFSYSIPANAPPRFNLRVDVLQENGPTTSKTLVVTVEPTSVVGVISSNPNFSILIQALTQTNLITTLTGAGPYTLFAPTNDAFNKLLDQLGMSQQELLQSPALANILNYHLLNSELLTSAMTNRADVETSLAGKYITTYTGSTADSLGVNNAAIDTADLQAKNGVVHIINEVLTPDPNIDTVENVMLMAPNSTENNEYPSKSFFSSLLKETFSPDEVVSDTGVTAADIDLGYYYGVTSSASLASPAQYPNDIYNLGPDGINWGTLNDTQFKTANISAEYFNSVKDNQDYKLVKEFDAGTDPAENAGRVTQLAAGDIIAYKTSDNRYGLIQILEVVDGNNNGSFIDPTDGMRISVKVSR